MSRFGYSVKVSLLLFLLIVPSVGSLPYGEDSEALGQFVDEFETLGNVSVAVDVVRNSSLNVMTLNFTVGGYGDFAQHIPFDIDYTLIDSNLSGFPVLLEIGERSGIDYVDTTIIFDEIGASYYKIAVTNEDMSVEYYVDVEFWDSAEEQGYLWIAPDVSSLENTTILLHYDFDVANNTGFIGQEGSGGAIAQNVWDSNFLLVSHLRDNPNSANVVDSTSNDNDGVKVGADEPGMRTLTGMIGPDQTFDGNNDFITFDDFMSISSAVTIEFMINRDQIRAGDGFISKRLGGNDFQLYDGLGNELRVLFWGLSDVTHIDADYFTGEAGNEIYLAVKYDGSDVYMYKNGTQTFTDDATGNIVNEDIDVRLGTDGFGNEADAKFDEVRISNISRSPDWIEVTQYSNFDELGYWRESSGAGYVESGYFTTTDYLDYVNGSTLALMTQSIIFPNTQITIQFSTDNSTWGDAEGIPGDSHVLLGGLETIDLRPLNVSTSVYVMGNLSTSDNLVSPLFNQSRLITTQGEGVGVSVVVGPSFLVVGLMIGLIIGVGIIIAVNKS